MKLKEKEKVQQLSASNVNWPELEKKVYMQTFKRLPVTLVRGSGMKVWDSNGKEYLDFFAGLAVNCLGHCHPVVVEALTEQANTLIQTSNLFYTVPQTQLAELLVKTSCLDRVFICNSGAEANEGAIKLARRYGKLKLNGAYKVITTHESFHGRTLATTAATGQAKFQEPYIPLPNGFVNVDYSNISAIKAATDELTCAIMLEPIQGEGGVNVPDDDYLKKVRDWCNEKGILLILDEVQTGIGRTGTLFAYEQYGIEPDIMTLAKGLGGGVPIGAFLSKENVTVFKPGEHGTTFGGNPLVCSVAVAVLNYVIENNISNHVKVVGQYFVDKLKKLAAKYDCINEVRGKGLLLAIGFNADISEDVMLKCLEAGLLVNNVKPNSLRFIPPLIATDNDVDKAVEILDKVLKERK
ncbi:MAG: acetylornithine transaminase [Dehalococcoidia bacterium]|nr:acetylornithine transaminase [Dehalococcoidia bacterium]MDD5493376.1 acetylornithine transaminase [Dehalococcoidia bacterium]